MQRKLARKSAIVNGHKSLCGVLCTSFVLAAVWRRAVPWGPRVLSVPLQIRIQISLQVPKLPD